MQASLVGFASLIEAISLNLKYLAQLGNYLDEGARIQHSLRKRGDKEDNKTEIGR